MADTPNPEDALIRENIKNAETLKATKIFKLARILQVVTMIHDATQNHADTQHNEDTQGRQDAQNQEQTETKEEILRNETEQMSPHSPISPLFTLPLELRPMIWHQLSPRGLSIEVSRRFRDFGVEPIVSTYDWDAEDLFGNQIPREECLNILYGENLFEIRVADDAEISMKRFFGKENLRRWRYVVAIFHTASGFDKGTPEPDRQFWGTILPGLTDFS
ncbi:uncharacterized protein N7446_007401 [Penicillium canescens]|uniref:uncharacterized protein n=1 Tax=Penicillium canescens TaxID=5083 RepID=UPI0026E0A7FC|nr:uncharacterized protein N7446_007401 [Penicillium canescens]KAJ6063281.1 hypothetical protein N7446_007401 [Penicillium canescens]